MHIAGELICRLRCDVARRLMAIECFNMTEEFTCVMCVAMPSTSIK
jgi:hypothetical protein